LAAIFAPALIKKSNQGPEGNFSVNVKLPPKPLPPDVVVTDEQEVFKTIKVSKVEIPSEVPHDELPRLVSAEPISTAPVRASSTKALAEERNIKKTVFSSSSSTLAINAAAKSKAKQTVAIAAKQPVTPKHVVAKVDKPKPVAKVSRVASKSTLKPANKALAKKDVYALQLASFSQVANAQSLVNRLRSRGYKASLIRTTSRTGPMYKVFVGHSPDRNQVLKLKTQLSQAMQLNGFIVNTGVS
jgi:DedD protein